MSLVLNFIPLQRVIRLQHPRRVTVHHSIHGYRGLYSDNETCPLFVTSAISHNPLFHRGQGPSTIHIDDMQSANWMIYLKS